MKAFLVILLSSLAVVSSERDAEGNLDQPEAHAEAVLLTNAMSNALTKKTEGVVKYFHDSFVYVQCDSNILKKDDIVSKLDNVPVFIEIEIEVKSAYYMYEYLTFRVKMGAWGQYLHSQFLAERDSRNLGKYVIISGGDDNC